jgi:hypothetical protein
MALVVSYEDGTTETVVADQRDSVAFERAESRSSLSALKDSPVLFMRFQAWHALRRQGAIPADTKRDVWETRCTNVAWDFSDTGEAIADPTKPVARTASQRRSPTGRGRTTSA